VPADLAQVLNYLGHNLNQELRLMRKNSGFTTYELMVTIAIMAVIAAITMPPYLKWYRSSRLRSAASSFTVDFEMAKTEAIRENDSVVMELFPRRYIIFVDSNDDWNSSGENVLLTRDLPPGVSIDTASLNLPVVNHKVRFNSRGLPDQIFAPQTIKIIQASNDKQLTINRLGNINVQ
jgi:prepilin-type N-terminal cleavage/methylation domain-containing protein